MIGKRNPHERIDAPTNIGTLFSKERELRKTTEEEKESTGKTDEAAAGISGTREV